MRPVLLCDVIINMYYRDSQMPIIPPVLFFDSELGGNHKSYFPQTRRHKMSRPKAIHHINKCVTAVLFYILTFSFLLAELKDGRVNLET